MLHKPDLRDVDLNDKFDINSEQVFLNGTQALIRLCLAQSHIDQNNGLNTAGYISGYRGSPLGALDQQFTRAKGLLEPRNIIFEAGLNEDLAATALWGTQQAELRGEGKYDGVFGIWYGKGPGVDRSGDALRHGNLAGSSKHGGVLVVMGDDHTCESSTTCHQSEFAMADAMIPVLNPAGVAEILEYGLHGWALSRFAGVWCGLKCVKDNIESTSSITHRYEEFKPILPEFEMPPEGLNIQMGDSSQAREAVLHRYKLDAVRAYTRANKLDKIVYTGGDNPKIGIITTGKSYMDTHQALEALGIDEAKADKLGLAIYKVAVTWPLEPHGIGEFAQGLERIIVVEEKRALIEDQLKSILYDLPVRPQITGKKDANGEIQLQSEMDLSPVQIAIVIGKNLVSLKKNKKLSDRITELQELRTREISALPIDRGLFFCAGCPHNTSTNVPEGSRAYAGIGCHTMVIMMDRQTNAYTHMGAEGSNWIGESKFSNTQHVFQNLGDGTYNHSGILAMRAAVASNTTITYKLLYNDAVALTGGQAMDGGVDVYRIADEISAIGVEKLVFVGDELARINTGRLPQGVTVYPRDELDAVQRELAQIKGVTALIYDQTCASEKRRRRKRGIMDPIDKGVDKHVFINEDVCEGCGDCGVASNCVAVQPVETEFGRKRKIDQFSCNKDFSCIDGFCPSFVTVTGAELKKAKARAAKTKLLPEPAVEVSLDQPYSVLITGVGGTGIVTIGALLGMAAHLEGKGCGIIDMAGLAQKGGSVTTHLKLAANPAEIKTIRVAEGGADLLLGGDLIVSSGQKVLGMLNPSTKALVNAHEFMPGDFTMQPDLQMPSALMHKRLKDAVLDGNLTSVNSSDLALKLFGDAIASNMFIVGVAYQKGLLPLSRDAIFRAIELNGVAIDLNKQAFDKGRQWVVEPETIEKEAGADGLVKPSAQTKSLDELIVHRAETLVAYQDQAYSNRYKAMVDQIKAIDQTNGKQLTHAVAKYAFKLMAYKDEYEVARLYSNGAFADGLKSQFAESGKDYKLTFHLAPPFLSKPDPVTGKIKKREFGPWVMPMFKLLAKLKGLRGSKLDIFGYSHERKLERSLIHKYQEDIDAVSSENNNLNVDVALALLQLPEDIRGFGHVKKKSIDAAAQKRSELKAELNKGKMLNQAIEPAE
ncbi:MAG: indolepyruvate ferredoxin oxidoreductase family protein [Lentilitoribacter sp.]